MGTEQKTITQNSEFSLPCMIPRVIEKLSVIVSVYRAKIHKEFGIITLAEHSKMESSYILYFVHFLFDGIKYKVANAIFLSPELRVLYVICLHPLG